MELVATWFLGNLGKSSGTKSGLQGSVGESNASQPLSMMTSGRGTGVRGVSCAAVSTSNSSVGVRLSAGLCGDRTTFEDAVTHVGIFRAVLERLVRGSSVHSTVSRIVVCIGTWEACWHETHLFRCFFQHSP